jgi:NDP-sugar pyrophosphorylase family protein
MWRLPAHASEARMKAMVLAAGLGTRLRPLTNDRPKALVDVAGKTLLELTITRLKSFGVDEVIVNVHHFAEMVVEYLKARENFGIRIEISREDHELLDTGGGLKKAAWFLTEHAQSSPLRRGEPFLVHNVDVLSTIDLRRLVIAHVESGALATLAVQQRETSRYLLFDENGQLCGRRAGNEGQPELVRAASHWQARAFSGIHVVSSRIFPLKEEGAFSIVQAYLRLAGEGEKIQAFRADEYYWRDLGRPENVARAAEEIKQVGVNL